jgi:glycosyltransferase involved in cell wall biosynthesis
MSDNTQKKRIIFLSARFPLPAVKGDQLVAVQRLKVLIEQYDVELVCLSPSSEAQKKMMHEFGVSSIKTFKTRKFWAVFSAVFNYLFWNKPLQIGLYSNKKAKQYIQKSVKENRIEFVFASLIRVWDNIDGLKKERIILDYVDCQILNLDRRIGETYTTFFKWFLKRERDLLKKLQIDTFYKINFGVFVSKIDKDYLIKKANLIEIPLGIKISNDFMTEPIKIFDIIFTGNMKYFPNYSSINWFIKNVFPIVVANKPNVKMLIAGRFAHTISIPEEFQLNIEARSDVADMATTIKLAKIAVAPMIAGSGMQFKILEAMAVQVPVITNSLGLGAIEAAHNHNIIVAETREGWASAINSLVGDQNYCTFIGQNGRDLVEKNHDINRISKLFANALMQSFG